MMTIDKPFVKKSFNACAGTYDHYAGLQEAMGARLLELAGLPAETDGRMLDIGMGTGNLTAQLMAAYPSAQVHGCDIAINMIAHARGKLAQALLLCTVADAEQLPYAGSVFNLVASNFSYQWLDQWRDALDEVMRVLRPGGLFIFSAFGGNTFCELRQAFSRASRETGYGLGEALALPISEERMRCDMSAAGFSHVSGITYSVTAVYASVNELVRAIKGMGARNASTHRNRSTGVRRVWRRMIELYEQEFGTPEGVPATFEIIMVRGKKPAGYFSKSVF
jgi:malonyl-CoA O-methyltransferase